MDKGRLPTGRQVTNLKVTVATLLFTPTPGSSHLSVQIQLWKVRKPQKVYELSAVVIWATRLLFLSGSRGDQFKTGDKLAFSTSFSAPSSPL